MQVNSNASDFFARDWQSWNKQMAIANLLGVAGTDVPIRDIKKLMMPFTVSFYYGFLKFG